MGFFELQPLTDAILVGSIVPQALQLVWVAVLGACIGSFMNVVVYRLPRGKSIVHPPSACPRCGHAIRWYHNLPVLGWLLLGGRCHDCRAPISPRYPLVEAAVAGMLLALALVGPVRWGADLPAEPGAAGPWWPWLLLGFHALLLCVLLCLGLIELDGDDEGKNRFPTWLVVGALVLGLLAPAALPGLGASWDFQQEGVVSANKPAAQPSPRALERWQALGAGMAGGLAGVLLAVIGWPATRFSPWKERGRWFAMAGLVLVGVYLGWSAAAVVAVVATALTLAAGRTMRVPYSLWLVPLTLGWTLFAALR